MRGDTNFKGSDASGPSVYILILWLERISQLKIACIQVEFDSHLSELLACKGFVEL